MFVWLAPEKARYFPTKSSTLYYTVLSSHIASLMKSFLFLGTTISELFFKAVTLNEPITMEDR